MIRVGLVLYGLSTFYYLLANQDPGVLDLVGHKAIHSPFWLHQNLERTSSEEKQQKARQRFSAEDESTEKKRALSRCHSP